MSKRSIITGLSLSEISHVGNPANPGARVVLWKKADTQQEGVEPMSPEELQKKVSDLETLNSALITKAKDLGIDVTVDGQTVTMTKSAAPEMIEFEGEMIAKSAIPAPVLASILKSRADNEELRKRLDGEELVKRADKVLPNFRGTATERGAILKAVDSIADETVRKTAHEALVAADAAMGAQMVEKGSGHIDETTPAFKLDALAKKYAAEKGVGFHAAFAEVVKTAEGRALAASTMNKN